MEISNKYFRISTLIHFSYVGFFLLLSFLMSLFEQELSILVFLFHIINIVVVYYFFIMHIIFRIKIKKYFALIFPLALSALMLSLFLSIKYSISIQDYELGGLAILPSLGNSMIFFVISLVWLIVEGIIMLVRKKDDVKKFFSEYKNFSISSFIIGFLSIFTFPFLGPVAIISMIIFMIIIPLILLIHGIIKKNKRGIINSAIIIFLVIIIFILANYSMTTP